MECITILGEMQTAGERTHLALDGKSLRGTRRRGEASKAVVHTVGLYNVTANVM